MTTLPSFIYLFLENQSHICSPIYHANVNLSLRVVLKWHMTLKEKFLFSAFARPLQTESSGYPRWNELRICFRYHYLRVSFSIAYHSVATLDTNIQHLLRHEDFAYYSTRVNTSVKTGKYLKGPYHDQGYVNPLEMGLAVSVVISVITHLNFRRFFVIQSNFQPTSHDVILVIRNFADFDHISVSQNMRHLAHQLKSFQLSTD